MNSCEARRWNFLTRGHDIGQLLMKTKCYVYLCAVVFIFFNFFFIMLYVYQQQSVQCILLLPFHYYYYDLFKVFDFFSIVILPFFFNILLTLSY